ncbi:MAG: nitrophenyl compound nitroreductase subunit ArsF family protein [Candidatus Zixiibacteriota bacterium]
MNPKRVITVVLMVFVAVSIIWLVVRDVSSQKSVPASDQPSSARQLMVYYFHRTARCPTCLKIEALAKQEVEATFAAELASGRMRFQSINVEGAGNEHFIKDYELVSQALILVDYRAGTQHRWKNLDAIWDLVDHESDFAQYVRMEIQVFRGAA